MRSSRRNTFRNTHRFFAEIANDRHSTQKALGRTSPTFPSPLSSFSIFRCFFSITLLIARVILLGLHEFPSIDFLHLERCSSFSSASSVTLYISQNPSFPLLRFPSIHGFFILNYICPSDSLSHYNCVSLWAFPCIRLSLFPLSTTCKILAYYPLEVGTYLMEDHSNRSTQQLRRHSAVLLRSKPMGSA